MTFSRVLVVLALCITLAASAKPGLGWSSTLNLNSALNLPSLWDGSIYTVWYYDWNPLPAAPNPSQEYVPMAAKTTDAVILYNNALANAYVTNKLTYFLAFNEPDVNGITVATAVSLWKEYMEPIRSHNGNYRLGAPAVSSGSGGLTWIEAFIQECTGCNIDFVPLHWYGSNANTFESYVASFHTAVGSRTLWVTEFACVQYSSSDPACDQTSVYNFMGQTTAWLDGQSYIFRYAWFGMYTAGIPTTNALFNTAGNARTGLGNQYITEGGHS